jgi:hypothetical protein
MSRPGGRAKRQSQPVPRPEQMTRTRLDAEGSFLSPKSNDNYGLSYYLLYYILGGTD